MILCQECGNSAPSRDGFCSSCGALLDWSGERVDTRILPLTPAAAAEQARRAAKPDPAASAAAPGGAKVWTPGSAQPAAQAPASAPPPRQPEAVRPGQPVASSASGAETPSQPGGWLPTVEAQRTDPVPAMQEPEYTGLYCQACGVRNPEGRRFCRSCGAMLQLPAVPVEERRSWWQRLIDRLLGRRRDFAAGERPAGFRDHHAAGGKSQASGDAPHKRRLRLPRHIKLGKFAPLLIIAGLLGIGLGPARAWVTSEAGSLLGLAKAKVNQHYASVTPVGATASSEDDHGAGLAIDGLKNTYWASELHTDGVGDVLTVTFASPVNIDQIGILSGADTQNFHASARPHDLIVSAAGTPDTVLSFDDSADFQNRAITLRHVTTVTFTVKDSYPGQQKHDIAIRDIEFFVKS
ncbi:MAG TPA: zinc-ribbon domain-containing protein [Actinocrinis sp.]|uniref:NADase-type glycan-binding domain-containing protein n=1 Tax=Actinocrinis sp. TaxID=1920516 RepID=UPI002DDD1559|nr:zinc-ribbon domain-containing protein [Actinocrinis sp.]HEV2344284.1 zinc-ribbon domain-containing protein [Actinocrinis sp.]